VEGQNKSITFDGREIRLTTGLYAPQASGSVMIECGDTSLLVTATKTAKKEPSDFLPLICDYEEKLYAAGRIPGGFMRREGRPPERATLIARLIDRPMRPLFPTWMRDEIQIVASCLSLDERVPADVLAVTGASIATLVGEIPFYGPMAAVRVGLIGDDFILNPSYREIEKGDLDIVVAGSPDGIVMIEAGANQLSEQDTIEAIDFGYEAVTELIKSQEDLLQDLGIKQIKPSDPEEDKTLPSYLEKNCTKSIELILKKFFLTKEEKISLKTQLKEEVRLWWRTDELHQFKPSVLDEVDYALHYFQQVLFNAMPQLRGRITEALTENYPDVQLPSESFCNFGSWVGSDRDGNPSVTPEITWRTACYQRQLMLERYIIATSNLRDQLSVSMQWSQVSSSLLESLETDRVKFPEVYETRATRYRSEPYRLKLSYILEKLRLTQERNNLLAENGWKFDLEGEIDNKNIDKVENLYYKSVNEFTYDLELIKNSLISTD